MNMPLQLAATDELLDELKKRTEAFIYCGAQEDQIVFALHGNQLMCKGLLDELQETISEYSAQQREEQD